VERRGAALRGTLEEERLHGKPEEAVVLFQEDPHGMLALEWEDLGSMEPFAVVVEGRDQAHSVCHHYRQEHHHHLIPRKVL